MAVRDRVRRVTRIQLINGIILTIVALLELNQVQAADLGRECVYSVNYDIRLSPGKNYRHQATRRVQVYEDHTIPVVFGDYRVDLTVSGIDDRKYLLELRLFERTDDATHPGANSTYWQINPTPIEISGRFSNPLRLHTYVAGIELDLAIAISKSSSVQPSVALIAPTEQ